MKFLTFVSALFFCTLASAEMLSTTKRNVQLRSSSDLTSTANVIATFNKWHVQLIVVSDQDSSWEVEVREGQQNSGSRGFVAKADVSAVADPQIIFSNWDMLDLQKLAAKNGTQNNFSSVLFDAQRLAQCSITERTAQGFTFVCDIEKSVGSEETVKVSSKDMDQLVRVFGVPMDIETSYTLISGTPMACEGSSVFVCSIK